MYNVIILSKSVLNEDKNEYYFNIFLEESLYKDKSNAEYFLNVFVYYKYYISTELRFLKKLISIKQLHSKSVIFIIKGIFIDLSLSQMSATDVIIY